MSHNIFDNDLVAICKSNVTLTLNKPVYVRVYILDLSKVLMHEFDYDHIKNKCGKNSRLSFMDTYGLLCKVVTEDVY